MRDGHNMAGAKKRGRKREEILRSLDGRRTAFDLAREVGCSPKYVRFVARREGRTRDLVALDSGFMAQIQALRSKLNLERLALSPEVMAWLMKQTGNGVTIADVIRGVLVDAWADAMEGGEP